MQKDHASLLGIVGLLLLASVLSVPIAYLARPAPRIMKPHYAISCDWHDWRLQASLLVLNQCGPRGTPSRVTLEGREVQIGPLHFQRWF